MTEHLHSLHLTMTLKGVQQYNNGFGDTDTRGDVVIRFDCLWLVSYNVAINTDGSTKID